MAGPGPERTPAQRPEQTPNNPPLSAITITREGKAPQQVAVRSIDALFGSVAHYNEQFSMGTMMARFIMAHLEAQMKDDETREPSLQTERREQFLTAAQIDLIHSPVLSAMGLSLDPAEGKEAVMMTGGEQVGTGELRMHVADAEQFTSFLQAIPREGFAATALPQHLATVSNVLAQQLLDTYDLQNPSPHALELLGGMGAVLQEYKRLGVPAQRLETYYAHAQKQDLREYLLVEHFGLLTQPGQYFGPADWQKDSTPQQLLDRWKHAFQTIAVMGRNPHATELRGEVTRHLRNCASIALADLQTLPHHSEEEKRRLGIVLGRMLTILSNV